MTLLFMFHGKQLKDFHTSHIKKLLVKINNEYPPSTGFTKNKVLFETKYLIPDNSKRETLIIAINAENEIPSHQKSYKYLL